MYKMNTFHWHLTEDQGWRIEIKKYPKLTEVGAWRNGTMAGHYSEQRYDTIRYGGFYSQEDVKEIVAYAAQHHVTIVPEIEMPGHALAALAAYPQYSCTGGPFEVAKGWGVFEDVFCPKEETFKFLEDVLTEVCALFPGKYIHIGGDECPKVRWKESEYCQQLMKREGLKDEHELQSYFVQRIEKFLNSKGKQIIGWDEILEGGLAPNAAVMSWRGIDGGIAAAKQKHNVVMSPGSHCYFDQYQDNPEQEPLAIGGYISLEKVYSYEPAPAELSEEEKKYILGAQGNVWSEYIPDFSHVEYLAMPRMCALAEVLWMQPAIKDENNFLLRLKEHFNLLDKMGVNYSKAIFSLTSEIDPAENNEGVLLVLFAKDSTADIRYTTDGTKPTSSSEKYISALKIKSTSNVRAALFSGEKRKGSILEQKIVVAKSTGKKITLDNPPSTQYNSGGVFTLVNGISGSEHWNGIVYLGFDSSDMAATIDLGSVQEINKVTAGFTDDEGAWIHLPSAIEIFISDDGKIFSPIKSITSEEIKKQGRIIVAEIEKVKTRYIKVIAHRLTKIPEGKPGGGQNSWLFVDEITVE
jgi:hexosaminidase